MTRLARPPLITSDAIPFSLSPPSKTTTISFPFFIPTKPPTNMPSTKLSALTSQLPTASPTTVADILERIRRELPSQDPSFNPATLANAASNVLRQHPSNLIVAHRAVAVLAHPALCGVHPDVEPTVVHSMDRLAMSAAFQHTAMAALQNSAGGHNDRDHVVLAVVAAMRQHQSQNGVLLRGADLIAYHLNQTPGALTSTYRVASRIIVETIDQLSATPQGASTALLALVATVRHISSLFSFGGRPSSATRFSRSSAAAGIVDHQFAYAIVLAMSRHRTYAPVQVLGSEVIRVGAAGATSVARLAAKELFGAGATNAVVAALQAHATDATLVHRGVVALRSLLLGGGLHGRALKPSLQLEDDLAEFVARVVERVSDLISVKDRDLSSAAAVLAMDVRSAVAPRGSRRERYGEGGRITDWGKRIIRRIRFGQKVSFYEGDDRYGDGDISDDAPRPTKDFIRGRRGSGRASFSMMHTPPRRGMSTTELKDAALPDVRLKMSQGLDGGDGEQMTLNRKWRSVSGRWNQRGRRGSTVNTDIQQSNNQNSAPPRKERRGPLTLSGSEMANLSRQPSRIFTGEGDFMKRRDARERPFGANRREIV